jgi:uncharacterized phage-associated protein
MVARETIDRLEGQDARGVANFVLDQFDVDRFQISNLKLNKLLFFAHGFFRSRFGRRLIRNHFEAWENGPVIRVVFDAFKQNGRSPIRNRAEIFDYVEGRALKAELLGLSVDEQTYLHSVIEYYVRYDAGQLVGLTHRPGTPWHRARVTAHDSRLRDRIPDEWIDNYFVENFGGRTAN